MPPPFPPRPCVICGGDFNPITSVNTCCSPECQRERKRLRSVSWYAENAEAHKARVVKQRRRRKRLAR